MIIKSSLLNFADCFVQDILFDNTIPGNNFKEVMIAADQSQCGEGVIEDLKSEFECQERCQKCDGCIFFRYLSDTVDGKEYCSLYQTTKSEVKGILPQSTGAQKGQYKLPSGDFKDFPILVTGPKFCGKFVATKLIFQIH